MCFLIFTRVFLAVYRLYLHFYVTVLLLLIILLVISDYVPTQAENLPCTITREAFPLVEYTTIFVPTTVLVKIVYRKNNKQYNMMYVI